MPRFLTIETEMYDPHALREICQHLGLSPPVLSEWSLGEEHFLGFLLTLPGCCQPVVLGTLTGLLRLVKFSSEECLESSLGSFLRAYSQKKAQRDVRLAVSSVV